MAFLLYNSLSRKKEIFTPLHPSEVKMYCCGPTVYDLLHIGNFRGAVFFNFLRLWLEHKGYKVLYAYNFTDVDDKILNRAQKENKTMKEVADKYIEEFKKDFKALKLKPHDYNPQATCFIPDMIKLILSLLENGKAYPIEGDIFFSVESLPDYGKLSRREVSELMAGARVEVDKRKKHPGDFALWKFCAKEEPGWDSPWGWGRPGWHLECTTMIFSLLGQKIDIHGGGTDLIFPHHENELAQAEGTFAKPNDNQFQHESVLDSKELNPLSAPKRGFVKYWVHHNMFTFGGEKMAKSTGNVSVMRDFLQEYNGEIFKYLVLSSHYRSLTEVSEKKILLCIQALFRVYTFLNTAEELNQMRGEQGTGATMAGVEEEITKSLNDDLNTPQALALLFKLIRQFNEQKGAKKMTQEELAYLAQDIKAVILKYGKIMGLFQEEPADFLKEIDGIFLRKNNLTREEVDSLVKKREQARVNRDFKLADQIRLQLMKMNIEVQDTREGARWETKKTDFPEENT